MTPDSTTGLRRGAEALASGLPPLLAEARQLAAAVQPGAHGRRRAGVGDEFWQYRPAMPFDEARRIDWRRSARSDQHFMREKEWQATQSVHLWVDPSLSMEYQSTPALPKKADRARLLALATAILLERAGERVGLADAITPPRAGQAQLTRIALALGAGPDGVDYGVPSATTLLSGARAVFLSDFFGDYDAVEATVLAASDRGITGALLQILDPVEETFPFAGRAIFESMGGAVSHETREAGGLRARYLDRLARRQDRLAALARQTGWVWSVHHTNHPAATVLIWLYHAIGQQP
jgi:uncharacterized protein (DUF58 family)